MIKAGIANCLGSATNLKASQSILLSCSALDTKSRYQTGGSLGITLREEQIPCLSLDCYKSDPARVDWRSLEDSDLSPLMKKVGSPSGTWRALWPWICLQVEKSERVMRQGPLKIQANVTFTSREHALFLLEVDMDLSCMQVQEHNPSLLVGKGG